MTDFGYWPLYSRNSAVTDVVLVSVLRYQSCNQLLFRIARNTGHSSISGLATVLVSGHSKVFF